MTEADDRREHMRRARDRELAAMALQAKELAQAALGEIRTHVAVCEEQNKAVLANLQRQDRVLNWIIALIVGGLGAVALDLLLKSLK